MIYHPITALAVSSALVMTSPCVRRCVRVCVRERARERGTEKETERVRDRQRETLAVRKCRHVASLIRVNQPKIWQREVR